MQRNLATKIRAKRESGLTAVWLKRDPPVYDLSPPILGGPTPYLVPKLYMFTMYKHLTKLRGVVCFALPRLAR